MAITFYYCARMMFAYCTGSHVTKSIQCFAAGNWSVINCFTISQVHFNKIMLTMKFIHGKSYGFNESQNLHKVSSADVVHLVVTSVTAQQRATR